MREEPPPVASLAVRRQRKRVMSARMKRIRLAHKRAYMRVYMRQRRQRHDLTALAG